MYLLESDIEHRVIRTNAAGEKFEYSDKKDKPTGGGWEHVDRAKHPRATKFLWMRNYSHVATEMRSKQRPKMVDASTKGLVSIDTKLFPRLDVEVGSIIDDFRQKLRAQFDMKKNPFMAGDRVSVKGEEGVFYVKKYDPNTQRMEVVSAADKSKTLTVSYAEAKLNTERGKYGWAKHDFVTIKAGAVDDGEVTGQVTGYDDYTNKVKVKVGDEILDVYAEAIIGIKSKASDVLAKIDASMTANPNILGDPNSKKVLDALFRASMSGWAEVTSADIAQDLASCNSPMAVSDIKTTLAAISSMGGSFYNPALDLLNIKDSNQAIRLMADARGVKSKNKLFGWKNLTQASDKEVYADLNQKVSLPPNTVDQNGKVIPEGVVKKIMGNRVEVNMGGTSRVFYMGELKDSKGRAILPDPTDPSAFGEYNQNTFWLLRDREWCQDYKRGDTVTLSENLEDIKGERHIFGALGRVKTLLAGGKLLVEMDGGKKLVVSPRHVRPNKNLDDLKQLKDRITMDYKSMYGTTANVANAYRVRIGDERKNKLFEVAFETGKDYKEHETSLFTEVTDYKATQNQTRAIALTNATEDTPNKTMVPNEDIMRAILRFYPSARRLAIIREMPVFPTTDTSSGKPVGVNDDPLDVKSGASSPTRNMQPASRKAGKKYTDHYTPAGVDRSGQTFSYDDTTGDSRTIKPLRRAEKRVISAGQILLEAIIPLPVTFEATLPAR